MSENAKRKEDRQQHPLYAALERVIRAWSAYKQVKGDVDAGKISRPEVLQAWSEMQEAKVAYERILRLLSRDQLVAIALLVPNLFDDVTDEDGDKKLRFLMSQYVAPTVLRDDFFSGKLNDDYEPPAQADFPDYDEDVKPGTYDYDPDSDNQ